MQQIMLRGIAFFLLVLTAAPQLKASPLYFFSSGHTGAQTQIDINHTAEWSFTPATPWELGGGRFVMKSGNKTASPIRLSIYRGEDSTGLLLSAVTFSSNDFCESGEEDDDCGQFNVRHFKLSFPIALSTGVHYFAQLTSDAPDKQTQAYFIKASRDFEIEDKDGIVVTANAVANPVASIPEPQGLSLLGLAVLAGMKRGERNRPPR